MAYDAGRALALIPDADDGAKWLFKAGATVAGARPVELPACERKDRYALWNPTKGEISFHDAEPGPLMIVANSPADFVDILNDVGVTESRVFVANYGVVAVLSTSADGRGERVHLPLTATKAYRTLNDGWRGSQQALINVLRNELAGCEKTGLLAIARTVRLTKGSDTTMVANHGAASVSADVQRKALLNGSDLPEFAEFEFDLFDELAGAQYTRQVRTVFDVDIEKATFSLVPLAAQIRDALLSTLQELAAFMRNRLREKDIKVFCGTIE